MIRKFIKKLIYPIVYEIYAEIIADSIRRASLAVSKMEIVLSDERIDHDSSKEKNESKLPVATSQCLSDKVQELVINAVNSVNQKQSAQ